MVEIEFIFNGRNIIIQGQLQDDMETILDKFINKAQILKNSVFYIYQGNILHDSNKDSKLEDIMGNNDRESKKMTICVNSINNIENNSNSIIPSKHIICPECKEFSKIELIDYKINLFDCKNGHNIDNIILSDFQNTQKIDISKIICHNCKENNKNTTHNNEFYRCINCKCNLCPLCKSIHNNCHYIINFEKQYFICDIHKEFFTQYCDDCELNICNLCENDHKSHTLIKYKEIIPNISEIKQQLNSLRNIIDEANNIIKETINKYNKIIENNEIYYNICKNLIKSYEDNNINYEILENLSYLTNLDYMKNINEDDLLDIYYKMNKIKIIKNYPDGKYIGELRNNLRDGKGIMNYKNGSKYEGEWKNNLREGKGIMYQNNGIKYEGDWKNDKKEGKGITIYPSGNKYEGEYEDDKRKRGTYTFKNGNKYVGEFHDKRNGKGIFYYNNGNKYEGNWVEDKKDGYGVMIYGNGDKYEGNWLVEKKDGYGTMIYKNGDKYEGNWVGDKKDGYGTMIYNNGNKYEGNWVEDKMEGKGIYYFSDFRYEGDFIDGKREGEGIIYYDDGSKEIGEFQEDEISEEKNVFIDQDWKVVENSMVE